jgi:hypothetical protein|tara:strand:- start:1315 stop:1545 length:231 start_codon:yes stop_codon:yes gene_type:complete
MEEKYIKVQDQPHLVRDSHSNGIVNTDMTAYERAIKRSKSAQAQRDELREATREINNIKCEMHEIKGLLQQLVSKQ